jgi:3'-phosphoadenosine 5'-phosphosulfate sulfotransferase (PAPS reductase)/FAD synthetase
MHIVSFSGGNDSSAMLLMLIKKIHIDKIIFADTTLEFPEMYEWIDKIEKYINRPIERVRPKKTWDDHFYGTFTRGKYKGRMRGFPFVIQKCWWNREAKYTLLDKAHVKGDIIYIGFTKEEGKRVMAKQYNKKNISYKFPLYEFGLTKQDCYDYLKSNGLYHPLRHMKRTGCWLCPKQSKSSLLILMREYPELWEKLKKYEADSPHGFKPKFSLKQFELEYDK